MIILVSEQRKTKVFNEFSNVQLKVWLIDWLIEDILQAPSTMSGDLRACN